MNRSKVLGATDIVRICGLSPYGGPAQVWLEKTGRATVEKNEAMERGLLLEPVAAKLWAERTGRKLENAARCYHKQHAFLMASPDYYDRDARQFVEIKTHRVNVRRQYGPPGSRLIPLHIMGQVIWQLHVGRCAYELDDAVVVAWFGADELADYPVAYDPDIAAHMEEAAVRFWHDYIETDTPPPPAPEADAGAIRVLWPRSTDEIIEADDRQAENIRTLIELKARKAELEKAIEERETAIMAAMKEAGVMRSAYGDVTWKTVTRTNRSVDYAAFEREFPEAFRAVVRTAETTYRRLTVKPSTEE